MYRYDYLNQYFKGDKRITKKEYMEKTGETRNDIEKLKWSPWPYQFNDYVFLKSPYKLSKKILPRALCDYVKSFGFRVKLNFGSKEDRLEFYYYVDQIGEILDIPEIRFKKDVFWFYDSEKEQVYQKLGIPIEKELNGYVTCDWELTNFVKWLWKNEIETVGWGYYSDKKSWINTKGISFEKANNMFGMLKLEYRHISEKRNKDKMFSDFIQNIDDIEQDNSMDVGIVSRDDWAIIIFDVTKLYRLLGIKIKPKEKIMKGRRIRISCW